jgi:hypothetical protein
MKTLIKPFHLFLILALILSCGNTYNNKKNMTSHNNDNMLKFKKFAYIDTMGTGLEAFSFLMPSDWKFEGGIKWNPEQVAMPVYNAFRVFNPVGQEEFEGFPNQCFFWSTNSGLLTINPPGSKYFGSIVASPVNAVTALQEIIQRARSQFSGLTIVSKSDLPELVEALGIRNQSQGPVMTEATGAKIRFSYVKNSILMEEEIYGVVEQVKFPVQSMFGIQYNIWWYIDYVFSFKGKAGQLEEQTKVFQTITSSFRINQQWQAKYNNVIEYLAQQQIHHIQSIGEFSRTLSQMSDQMRSDQLQQYEQRSSVYDKVAQQHSDNMLGIERYYDPFEEREIPLPSGYNHTWCNNLGEYIMTDNPNYNPNAESNLTWKPIEHK